MKVTPFVIEKFASFLSSGTIFSAMRNIVSDLEDTDLANEEKRQRAISNFKAIGYDIGGWIVNLLLELAVAWLRSKK